MGARHTSQRLERKSAHHALDCSVGRALSAARTALSVVVAACLPSKDPHLCPLRQIVVGHLRVAVARQRVHA